MRRKTLLLEEPKGPWAAFLQEFFEDTDSTLEVHNLASQAKTSFDRHHHDVLFVDPRLMPMNFVQGIKASKQTYSELKVIAIGPASLGERRFPCDDFFPELLGCGDFQRKFLKRFEFPDSLEVLVVDDEKDIGEMVRDFLESRKNPSFSVRYAENGMRGLEELEKKKPDVLVLDIKMPLKDGREVYRESREKNIVVPTIVFFDAISGDEISDVRSHGKAAVIEKGSPQSALPDLMELIKKMYCFS